MYLLKKVDIKSMAILKKLMKDTFSQAFEDMHTKENIEEYCISNFTDTGVKNILTSDIYTCIIAFKEDLPVGFLILKNKKSPYDLENTSIELQQLYILKSEYRVGLGKELLTHAIKLSESMGKEHLWLCVSNTNTKALSFYKKTGFENIGFGKNLNVGTDKLSSSIMRHKIKGIKSE